MYFEKWLKFFKDGSPSLKHLNILAWGFVVNGQENVLVEINQFESKKTNKKPKAEIEVDHALDKLSNLFENEVTEILNKIIFVMR